MNELKKGAFLDAPSFDLTEEERSQTRRALDGEIYRMQARRARFVLLRLDEILANDPGATYSQAIISIEHMLPQNPRPASDWTTAFSEDERRYWIHRLGNLVLLNRRKNAQASNYDFAAKKDRYFGASGYAMFALTAQVLQRERWTPTVVEARQRALVGRLVSEWDLG